jgi:hypothetical protein
MDEAPARHETEEEIPQDFLDQADWYGGLFIARRSWGLLLCTKLARSVELQQRIVKFFCNWCH